MFNTFITHTAMIAFGTMPLSIMHPAMNTPLTQINKPTVMQPAPRQTSGFQVIQPIAPIKETNLGTLTEIQPITPPAPPVPPAPKMLSFPYSSMGTYSNAYDSGQCTWGAASMKGNIPSNWGNADEWANMARAAGYTVSSTPVVGAVAQRSTGWAGHVAVVTAVNGDGTIQITEMNYDGTGDGLWRSRSADVSEFLYIYI